MIQYSKIMAIVTSIFEFFFGFSMTVLSCRKKKKLKDESNMSFCNISKWILNMVVVNMILLLLIWITAIVHEIMDHNLLIFYFSLVALILSLGLIIKTYLRK